MAYFGYHIGDFIPCELFGIRSNDTHHIKARGMGGTTDLEYDSIKNLMALVRRCHTVFGDKEQHIEFLLEAHFDFMDNRIPYIGVNPKHESFDALITDPDFGPVIKRMRLQKSTNYGIDYFNC